MNITLRIQKMKKVIEKQEEYILALKEAEIPCFSIAFAHGFAYSPTVLKQCEDLRQEIIQLKDDLR